MNTGAGSEYLSRKPDRSTEAEGDGLVLHQFLSHPGDRFRYLRRTGSGWRAWTHDTWDDVNRSATLDGY